MLREAFIERVFAIARLRELLSGPWRPPDLIGFHARHKLQFLAHDPRRNLLAGGSLLTPAIGQRRRPQRPTGSCSGRGWPGKATRGRQTNALLHAFSQVSKHLDPARRSDLLNRIETYRRGQIPLSVPVALLAHHASTGTLPWLAGQTYLQPFPAELHLRHNV